MADDWRVVAEMEDEGAVRGLGHRMREHRIKQDVEERLGERVVLTADGPHLFAYADSETAARAAESVIREVLPQEGVEATVRVERWHAVEERWEDLSVALPDTDVAREAEHARREADERAETREEGFAEWEVRVELPSHEEAVALGDRLEADGIPVVRRSHYLLVGAATEDDAHALEQRIRAEAPAEAELHAELSGAYVYQVTGGNRFAWLGGLGH